MIECYKCSSDPFLNAMSESYWHAMMQLRMAWMDFLSKVVEAIFKNRFKLPGLEKCSTCENYLLDTEIEP